MPRPFVLFNAAVSLDGKLAPASRRKFRLGSDRDRARMDRLRASSDAILVGAGTIRAENPPLQVRSPQLRRLRVRQGKPETLLEVIVSRSLSLPLGGRFLRDASVPRVVVVPSGAPRAALEKMKRRCEVLTIGRGASVDLTRLLDRLGRRGIERLLVEGGGVTFAGFFERNLVDEIHLTVCPWAIGGDRAPTLFDGNGFNEIPFPRYRLQSCRKEGEEAYLIYRR